MTGQGESELLHEEVRALLAIAEALNAIQEPQVVLDRMLATIVRELGYKAAALRMIDPEHAVLNLVAAYGLSQEYLDKGFVQLAQSMLDQEVLAGRTVALRDVTTDPGLQYPEAAAREGIRSALAVPLRLGERIVGVLRVYTAEVTEFSAAERAFLAGAANLAARAIADARLYAAFRNIARQVNSTLEVEQVLRNLLQSLIQELSFKAGSVRLLGPRRRRLHLAAAEGLSQAYLNKGEVRVADSPIDNRVLTENTHVILYDVGAEPGYQYPEEAAREGIRSVLAVPLRLRDRIVGVLRVYSAQPHRFTSEEIAMVEAVADLGAIALENARLHETLREKYEAAREDWAGWYRYLALS